MLSAAVSHRSEMASQGRDAADSDAAHLTAIWGEQRKSHILRDELEPRDLAPIESLFAEHAPLARRVCAAA